MTELECLKEYYFNVLKHGFELDYISYPIPSDPYNTSGCGLGFKYNKLTKPFTNHVEFYLDLCDSPNEDTIHTYTDDHEDEMPCSFRFYDFFAIFSLFDAIRTARIRNGDGFIIDFFDWAKTQLKPM